MARFALLSAVKNRSWRRPNDYFSLVGWEALLGPGATLRLSSVEAIPETIDLAGVEVALVLGETKTTPLVKAQLAARGIKEIFVAEHSELRLVEPEWMLTAAPLAHAKAKLVFCADESDQAYSVWTKLREEALLLPGNAAAFRRLGTPGINALFAPFFPEAHLKAVATASRVIAMDAVTARAAQALGVPSKNYGSGGMGVELPPLSAAALQTKRADQRRRVGTFFSLSAPVAQPTPQSAPLALNIACGADWTSLPLFLGLATNLREVHGANVRFYFLALDEATHAFMTASPLLNGGKVFRESDLWNKSDIRVVKLRPPAARLLTTKPKLLAAALEASGGNVAYCDLNLFFYESPAAWLSFAETEAVKVCPGRNPAVEQDWQYGLFQSGLVGVNNRAETFLEWWGELTFVSCEGTGPKFEDHFEDQGYLDLAPTLFAEFKVDWAGVHNVAPWSERVLNFTPDPQVPWRPVALGQRVASFHRQSSDSFQFGSSKAAWDQVACFFSAYPWRKAERVLTAVACTQSEFLGPLCHLLGKSRWFTESPAHYLWMWKKPWRGLLTPLVTRTAALRRKWRTFRGRHFKMPLSPCNSLTPHSSIS